MKQRCPWRRGSGRFFLDVNAKMHESEKKFSVRNFKTIKLNESYRLVTTVLVLNSHSRKIHSIFLTTIAAAARSRHSNFWARRGSGALAIFFYHRRAAAVSFQPRWTSLLKKDNSFYVTMLNLPGIDYTLRSRQLDAWKLDEIIQLSKNKQLFEFHRLQGTLGINFFIV